MTCVEFREQLQLFLDRKVSGPLPAELQTHADSCAECNDFLSGIMVIERGLREMRHVPVPPRLLESLSAIADRKPATGLLHEARPYLPLGMIYSVPILLIWLLAVFLEPETSLLFWIGHPIIVFGMFCYLSIRFYWENFYFSKT